MKLLTLDFLRTHFLMGAATLIFAATIALGGGGLALEGYPRLAAWLAVASIASAGGALMLAGRRTAGVFVVIAGAIVLRWIAGAALLEVLTPPGHHGVFNPDEIGFDRVATTLANGDPVASDLRYLLSPFTGLITAAYDVGGTDPLAGKAVTAACGILTVGVVHRIAIRVDGGRRPAIVAAVMMAAWPTTLGWSVTLLKESTIVLAVALAVMGVIECTGGRKVVGGSLALVSGAWLITVRPSDAAVLVAGEIIVGLVWLALRSRAATAAVLAAVVVICSTVGLVPALRERLDATPGALRTHRIVNSAGNTRLGADFNTTKVFVAQSTWPHELERLPTAAATVWLRPAPWEVVGSANNSQRLGAAVAPLWYLALMLGAVGVVTLTRRGRPWQAWMLAAPVLLSVLPLATGEGNLGTAVRHRDSVSALLLTLAATGVVAAAGRTRSFRPARAGRTRSRQSVG